jgi:AmmeMemoRadiSam system protein B
MVLIRDQLGIIPEGRAVDLFLYQILTLLDGTRTLSDLQIELMRLRGGVLVGSDEIASILGHLDESFLLDSDRYRAAKDQMIAQFSAEKTRPCYLCGRSYPRERSELAHTLDSILATKGQQVEPEGKVRAIVAPHIDLSAGAKVYASAYGVLRHVHPSTVIVLGIGHHMIGDIFSITEKDYATPFGVVRNETVLAQRVKQVGAGLIAPNDFEHRSEHSIEFQMLFLHHLLEAGSFTALPILCGSLMANLSSYSRDAYLEKAGPFLDELKAVLQEKGERTLVVAGVDFSHIGLKFGHETPAAYIDKLAETHDKDLLNALCEWNADLFWETSRNVDDRFNVCGFPALACLLEILPPLKGRVLDYHMHHEAATQSAVSFSAAMFSQ